MAVFLAVAPALQAQPETAVTTLDTVVVTASRGEESLREVTTNMTVIDEKTINSSSAATLDDLLAQQGFKIKKNPGAQTSIEIRGFKTDAHGNDLGSHVLLLIDGRRRGSSNASMISLVNVERIEIIRGPAAVQYGAAAMGGVVNVITKKGLDQPFKASAEVGFGMFDYRQSEIKMSGSAGQFDFAAGLHYSEQGDYEIGGGETYVNSGYEKQAASLNLGYSFADTQRLGLVLEYFRAPDSGMPGSYKDTGLQARETTDKSNYLAGLDYTGSTADGRFSWLARYTNGKDKREVKYRNSANSTFEVDQNSGQIQGTYNHDYFSLTAGLDYLDYDMTNSQNASAVPKSDYTNTAGFLLAKVKLLDDSLIFSAGGRYDHFKFTGSGNDRRIDNKETNFSPSVGLAYLPVDWLKLRANYSQAFVMPTATELAANFVSGGYLWIGNPDLKPETSDTYEFGFDISGPNSNFSFTYFFSETQDFITYLAMPGREYHYRNMDRAYRTGMELAWSADIGGALNRGFELRPYASFNYLFKYKTRDAKTGPYLYIHQTPEYTANYGLRFHHPESDFTANLNFARTGKEYRSLSPTSIQNAPYTVASLFLRKRVMDFSEAGQLDLKLTVDNIFDEKYSTSYSGASTEYYMPGRSAYIGLVYTY